MTHLALEAPTYQAVIKLLWISPLFILRQRFVFKLCLLQVQTGLHVCGEEDTAFRFSLILLYLFFRELPCNYFYAFLGT